MGVVWPIVMGAMLSSVDGVVIGRMTDELGELYRLVRLSRKIARVRYSNFRKLVSISQNLRSDLMRMPRRRSSMSVVLIPGGRRGIRVREARAARGSRPMARGRLTLMRGRLRVPKHIRLSMAVSVVASGRRADWDRPRILGGNDGRRRIGRSSMFEARTRALVGSYRTGTSLAPLRRADGILCAGRTSSRVGRPSQQ